MYRALVTHVLRRYRRLLLFAALAVLLVPLIVWVALPWPGRLASTNPTATSFMRYREREAGETGTTRIRILRRGSSPPTDRIAPGAIGFPPARR